MDTHIHGSAFGRRFGAQSAESIVSRTLAKTEVAVTYMEQRYPTFMLSEQQPIMDGYLVSMGFLDFPNYQLWEGERAIKTEGVTAPEITIYDLRASPRILVNNPLVGLHFHMPRTAFDTLADQAGAARIGDLHYAAGKGMVDPVIHALGMALMPAFHAPEQVSRLFVDHVTMAVTAHVAKTYGGLRETHVRRGGLAAWQERIAKQMLEANLAGDISHSAIAANLGLSPNHFSRAFRATTGMPPHRWLMARRIDQAKHMLRTPVYSLATIAAACGFADQSHFTRSFTRSVGTPPGTWRRRVLD